MFNSLLSFITEERTALEKRNSSVKSVKLKQIEHDSFLKTN